MKDNLIEKILSTVPAPHIDKVLAENGGIEPAEYPCRCGVTHTGPYALYDYGHHNCLHNYEMLWLNFPDTVMCPGCGNTWSIREEACLTT